MNTTRSTSYNYSMLNKNKYEQSSTFPKKLNCSNTLTKFYNKAEENIKKLTFFDPKNDDEEGNLYNLKLVKKDFKKMEEKKNLQYLRQGKN